LIAGIVRAGEADATSFRLIVRSTTMLQRNGRKNLMPLRHVILVMLLSLAGCGGGGGSSPAATGVIIVTVAGTPQTVIGPALVTMSGSATSSTGTITGYQWQQTAGASVTLSNPGSATTSFTAPAVTTETQFTFRLTVTDSAGNTGAGAIGITDQYLHYYVAIGDSITAGYGDDYALDNTSQDGRNTGGGFGPVLNDLLTAKTGAPYTIANEGCEGATSYDGLNGNTTIPCDSLATVIGRHSGAQRYLVLYGMNDARPWLPVPSGQGLNPSDPGYPGTFKDNMQKIINALHNAGVDVALAKINVALADCAGSGGSTCTPYSYPQSDGVRNVLIQQNNAVIDELKNITANNITVTPPDLWNWSWTQGFYQTEYYDYIHPNGNGYRAVANLWSAALAP